MAKKDDVKKAIGGITLGDQEPEEEQETGGYSVVSVGLTGEQLAEVEAIAEELDQTRHAVLKYAVLDFVRRYNAGERPEYKTKKVLDTST